MVREFCCCLEYFGTIFATLYLDGGLCIALEGCPSLANPLCFPLRRTLSSTRSSVSLIDTLSDLSRFISLFKAVISCFRFLFPSLETRHFHVKDFVPPSIDFGQA